MEQQLQEQITTEDKKTLAEGVILYKKFQPVENDPEIVGIFTWTLEIKVLSCVDFEVDLEQSENIYLENPTGGKLKTISKVQPFETKVVAKVHLKNNWKLKSKFKLIMSIPDKGSQFRHIEKYTREIEDEIQQFERKLRNIPFEHLSIEESDKKLQESGRKFVDLEFLPNDESALYSIKDGEKREDCFDYVIHWKRIDTINRQEDDESEMNNKLAVFSFSDVQPDDIIQGLLPDNHLISAFSALAERYNLIKRLFKSEKFSKNGIYQVKLCINGEWVTVIIDDFFPCIPLGKPLVSDTDYSHDLWLLILEKAMAKVFGSYYNLVLNNILNYFLVLTGCPTQFFKLPDKEKVLIEQLHKYVVEKKYLVVAISKNFDDEDQDNNEENELISNKTLTVSNYGYTVIDVKTKYNENLIIVRKVWNDDSKKEYFNSYKENFIKSYQGFESYFEKDLVLRYTDFIKEFDSFVVCYAKNWDEVRIRGKFVNVNELNTNREVPLSKWYYYIQLEKVTNIIISLFQDDDQEKGENSRKQLMDISLSVLKKDSSKNEISHLQTLDFTQNSNIQLELNLPAGQYIILPLVSGCLFGRPFDKKVIEEKPIYNYSSKTFSPIFIDTVKDIFKKFDLLLNRKLGYSEFKGFWECTNKEPIDEDYFKENILSKYQSHEEGLTENGFVSFFEEEFLTEGGEEKVKQWLERLGYDNDLFPLKSRCFMLTFHSDNPISVSVRDALNTDLNIKVNDILLASKGKEIKSSDQRISFLQYQSENPNITSLGCINNGNVPYLVKLKLIENDYLIISGKSNVYEKLLQPKESAFYFNFLNLNSDNGIEGIKYELECNQLQDKK